MKKFLRLFLMMILISLACGGLFAKVSASGDEDKTRIVTIAKGQVIDRDYWNGGDSVNIEGKIIGDLFIAGGTVDISGEVTGDVIVAGATINISGLVGGNIRAAGWQVTISGKVAKNVTLFAGTVSISEEALISGSVMGGGGTLSLSAEIGKDLYFSATDVTLDGKIGRKAGISTDNLTITDKTEIAEKLTYLSSSEAEISEKAQIGSTQHNLPKEKDESTIKRFDFNKVNMGFRFLAYLSSLLIGLILVFLFPKTISSVTDSLLNRVGSSLGWGLLTLFVTPLFAIMLFITLLGIPLSMITIFFYGLAIYLSKIFVGVAFGKMIFKLLKKEDTAMVWWLFLGLFGWYVITMLPYVGWFISFLGLVWALGGMTQAVKDFVGKNR